MTRREAVWLGLAGWAPPAVLPVRLEQWLDAPRTARKEALSPLEKQIRRDDARIEAWVRIGAKPALAGGPLAEIPFAVKDVIDTRDFPTGWGSPLFEGRRAREDAWIVREFRRRGAVLFGKTHTAAFAMRDPPPTRNPRNVDHTPGGSSSGSAAAVAANMVPIAIGTQTGGSVIRPASYCGVVGFKPTHGLLPTEGVLPYAPSLDTLGLFTHTAEGMLRLWEALGYPVGREDSMVFGVADPVPDVEPAMRQAFAETIATLRRSGLTAEPVAVGDWLPRLGAVMRTVGDYEGAQVHGARFAKYGEQLGEVARVVERGRAMPESRYREALSTMREGREWIAEQFRRCPVILTPAATGPAPRGLASTGDSRLNTPWTVLGTPVVTIPMGESAGLPLGLQLAAAHGDEGRLLRTAANVASALRSGNLVR